MKFVSYLKDDHEQLAILVNGLLYDTDIIHPDIPNSMSMYLNYWEELIPVTRAAEIAIEEGNSTRERGVPVEEVLLLSPVTFPSSCRDAYAFRQHVETARKNRKLPMLAEFDQFPVFYFTNHHSVRGPGDIPCMPDHFQKLDFELEVAIVICKQGRNIRAEDADAYIGGFMIMNDISARTLQLEEMLLNLGPAKGKDFATATGPWLVTPDELQIFETACAPGHTGKAWNLRMQCRVNGVPVSDGSLGDMQWTFAEIIQRASYGVTLYPGDIIGSGTVGSGCFLELNGTGKLKDPDYAEQWLKEGDTIELEVEGLGTLMNAITREDDDLSLLERKISVPG